MQGKESLEEKIHTVLRVACFCRTPLQLANPTELQLDGVGVDFVFPLSQLRAKNLPPQRSTRRKCNTDMEFGI